MAANVDGILRAPEHPVREPRRKARRTVERTLKKPRAAQHRTIVKSVKETPLRHEPAPSISAIRPMPAPEAREEERKSLLYVFVGVALVGIVGLWTVGLSRSFGKTGSDNFFASVVQQLKEVFTGVADDISEIKGDIDALGTDEVEKLEKQVFPDLPNLND